MVNPRVRRHRRSRHRRFQGTYLLRPTAIGRLKFLLISPFLVIALHWSLFKQPGIAETFQPPISHPAFLSPSWVPKLAQSSIPIPLTRQGEQITLNGRSLSVPWSQRQQKIGIADAGLMQAFGVELLSTNDLGQQPVQWFSDPRNTEIVLPTWLTEQYRYLDVSELARQFGWRMQVQGASLQISTPDAKVTSVRQGLQSWGDRIVVDLNQPTPWQIDEQRGSATLTIHAGISPAFAQSFAAKPGNQLTDLKLEASSNRTVIRLGFPDNVRPRVWSLTGSNRLLIDIGSNSMANRDILWAPGIRWQQGIINIGTGRFPIVALQVNPHQPGVSVKPILGNPASAIGTAPLFATAQRAKAVAAINAGFFNRNTRLPLGAIRKDDRWLSGPILNRGAIAWNPTGNFTVGHFSLQETLITATGQQFPVAYLNSGYVGGGIYRHTQGWGSSYTNILDNEVLITVQNNQVVGQQHAIAAGKTTVPIPANGYLLVVRNDRTAASALAVGTTLRLETAAQPPEFSHYAEIVGAGPLLIQNQRIVLNPEAEKFSTAFIQQAASRSVIATMPEGTLVLVAIHNRLNGSGPTLSEVAQIMQQMGAVDALNLDGGSSTSLYLGGQLIDRSPSTAARVHNGIGIFIQPNL